MKTRILSFGLVAASLLLLLFAPGCTKENDLSQEPANPTLEEVLQIPENITQHLTEADWEDILNSQPPVLPEEVQSRDGAWHFWLAWGEGTATWYPITGDCDIAQIPDNICWRPQDCPGITNTMERFADGENTFSFNLDRSRSLSSIVHTFNNFVCGNYGPGNPAINIALQQNNGADRAQFYWTDNPDEAIPTFTSDSFSFITKFYPCTDPNPNAKCHTLSTGQFADIQGSLTYRWSALLANLPPPGTVFEEAGPASVITWGWLYY